MLATLEKGMTGANRCSVCKHTMSAELQRVNFQTIGYKGSKVYTRICASCILEFAAQVDLAVTAEWEKKTVIIDAKKEKKRLRKEEQEEEDKWVANKTF